MNGFIFPVTEATDLDFFAVIFHTLLFTIRKRLHDNTLDKLHLLSCQSFTAMTFCPHLTNIEMAVEKSLIVSNWWNWNSSPNLFNSKSRDFSTLSSASNPCSLKFYSIFLFFLFFLKHYWLVYTLACPFWMIFVRPFRDPFFLGLSLFNHPHILNSDQIDSFIPHVIWKT